MPPESPSPEESHTSATDASMESELFAGRTDMGLRTRRGGFGRRSAARRSAWFGVIVLLVLLLAVAGFFAGRVWMQRALRANLPVVDGQVHVAGLAAPVTVERDAQGVPHLRAASMDDLIFAQGYVTAGDRLWQMDALRRHAAGDLAEVLGKSLIEHDRVQRVLQLRAAADRALTVLPDDQRHMLEVYARGVNQAMAEQMPHLPLEFRLLRYTPTPWTPRDSLLVGLAMFEDLTMTYPEKLDREALTSKLAPELAADLYPVGSWRDRPAGQTPLDLTAPRLIEEIPLDESQSHLERPALRQGVGSAAQVAGLLAIRQTLAMLSSQRLCEGCRAGSNGWAVAGSRTASGKPMLSSDMHLSFSVPGIWYEADLEAPGFHAAGVTLPGTPFVIVGHNQHVAWGFTNLGADVQDLYVETTRGNGTAEQFQDPAFDSVPDGDDNTDWQPMLHRREVIHVKGAADVVLDVPETMHGGRETPVITGLYPHEKRTIAVDWTVYDPKNVTDPFEAVNRASDWTSMLAAMAGYGGPSQNMMYADDQGHIGYHAVGRVPVRGSAPAATLDAAQPAQYTLPSFVPVAGNDPRQQWQGYIPFDQMPQSFDPAGGVLATANARVTPDAYPYPVTTDWADPYRNERIWKVLGAKHGLASADMLRLQTDVYSDFDRVVAQRLVYAIDHVSAKTRTKRLRQAGDLMRIWDGVVDKNAAAPAIVDATRAMLWPMLLRPQLGNDADAWRLYGWGEKQYAEEQLIVDQPGRWLPVKYANWNELLAAAVEQALDAAHAPRDLSHWRFGDVYPLEIEHAIYGQSPLLKAMIGVRTGTGVLPQSGDSSTVKQTGRSFGPSERLTVDFGDLDRTTLNVVLGEASNPESQWFMDQFSAWLGGTTFGLPFSDAAVDQTAAHRLMLVPQ